MNEIKKIRAFLAIGLPEPVRRRIGELQRQIRPRLAGIRLTRPEGIHLTLKFFGYILPEDIPGISQAVEGPAEIPPFSVEVKGLGVFPSPRRARVLWTGVEGDLQSLLSLQREIEANLSETGFPREQRGFTPHLTLGRFKFPRPNPELEKIIEEFRDFWAGTVECGSLTLFKSDLRPDGAVYTPLETYKFGKK